MKNNTLIFTILAVIIVGVVALVAFSPSDEDADNTTSTEQTTVNTSTTNQETSMKNIVETAVEAGSFSTLATALETAGLIDTLSGEGPFTVFAPTDEAFKKLGDDAIAELLEDKERLTKILTYHVVAGKVMATDVVQLTSAATVEGSEVSIDATDGVKVNNATVTQTDIEASNGVIHVIDTVLIPE